MIAVLSILLITAGAVAGHGEHSVCPSIIQPQQAKQACVWTAGCTNCQNKCVMSQRSLDMHNVLGNDTVAGRLMDDATICAGMSQQIRAMTYILTILPAVMNGTWVPPTPKRSLLELQGAPETLLQMLQKTAAAVAAGPALAASRARGLEEQTKTFGSTTSSSSSSSATNNGSSTSHNDGSPDGNDSGNGGFVGLFSGSGMGPPETHGMGTTSGSGGGIIDMVGMMFGSDTGAGGSAQGCTTQAELDTFQSLVNSTLGGQLDEAFANMTSGEDSPVSVAAGKNAVKTYKDNINRTLSKGIKMIAALMMRCKTVEVTEAQAAALQAFASSANGVDRRMLGVDSLPDRLGLNENATVSLGDANGVPMGESPDFGATMLAVLTGAPSGLNTITPGSRCMPANFDFTLLNTSTEVVQNFVASCSTAVPAKLYDDSTCKYDDEVNLVKGECLIASLQMRGVTRATAETAAAHITTLATTCGALDQASCVATESRRRARALLATSSDAVTAEVQVQSSLAQAEKESDATLSAASSQPVNASTVVTLSTTTSASPSTASTPPGSAKSSGMRVVSSLLVVASVLAALIV